VRAPPSRLNHFSQGYLLMPSTLGVRISTCEFWGNVLCTQSLCDPMDCSLPGFSVPEIIPARILECAIKKKKNTGVGCHFPLQEIFHTQESNPSLLWLLHWLAVSLPLRHLGGDTTMFIFHEVENFQPTCGFGYLPIGSRGHMFSS